MASMGTEGLNPVQGLFFRHLDLKKAMVWLLAFLGRSGGIEGQIGKWSFAWVGFVLFSIGNEEPRCSFHSRIETGRPIFALLFALVLVG